MPMSVRDLFEFVIDVNLADEDVESRLDEVCMSYANISNSV